MIAVIDYGVGNLFSLCRSLEAVGQTPVVTGDPAVLRRADKLFLPGVGAFADAAEKLRRTGLDLSLIHISCQEAALSCGDKKTSLAWGKGGSEKQSVGGFRCV